MLSCNACRMYSLTDMHDAADQAEAVPKQAHTDTISRQQQTVPASNSGRGAVAAESATHTEPAAFSNAARLVMGQTEVLVAPGMKPAREQKTDETAAETASAESAAATAADAAAGPTGPNQAEAIEQTTAGAAPTEASSAGLELDLDGASESAVATSEVAAASGQPMTEEQAAIQNSAEAQSYPLEQQQGSDGGAAVNPDAAAVDLEMHSVLSDGADSYQGLPDEQPANHASINSEDGVPGEGNSPDLQAVPDTAEAAAEVNLEPQQQEFSLQLDSATANSGDGPMLEPAPQQAGEALHRQQQHQPETADPAATMEMDGQQVASDGVAVQTAGVAEQPSVAAASVARPALQAETDKQVEVVRSAAPGQWSWQMASLLSPGVPKSGTVGVILKAQPTDQSVKAELVDVGSLRRPPPLGTYVTDVSALHRGDVLEVDMGDGKYMCAVLVSKVKPLHKAQAHHCSIEKIVQGLHAGADELFTGQGPLLTCRCLRTLLKLAGPDAFKSSMTTGLH